MYNLNSITQNLHQGILGWSGMGFMEPHVTENKDAALLVSTVLSLKTLCRVFIATVCTLSHKLAFHGKFWNPNFPDINLCM